MPTPSTIGGVFISYSHADERFVDALQAALVARNINVWRDVHDLNAGPIAEQVVDAIRRNDVVLLVLSEAAVKSDWVDFEIMRSRQREKLEGRVVLCPIAIDNAWKAASEAKPHLVQLAREKVILSFDPTSPIGSGKNAGNFAKLLRGMKLYYGYADGLPDASLRYLVGAYDASKIPLDQLPYTPEFEQIHEGLMRAFPHQAATRREMFIQLYELNKAGKLVRHAHVSEPELWVSEAQEQVLIGLLRDRGIDIDQNSRLPYDPRLDDIAEAFARLTDRTLAQQQIWRLIAKLPKDNAKSFSLYFDLDEYPPTEIALIIGLLSSLYQSVGGDALVIEDATLLDPTSAFEPVGGGR